MRVYGIRDNQKNKIVYFGKTVNNHDYIPHGKRIREVMKLHPLRYEYIILEQISDINILDEREIFYIEQYNTFNDQSCFNYTKGGGGGWTLSKLTVDERKKIKEKELKTKLENPHIMKDAARRARETFNKRPLEEQQQMHQSRIEASIRSKLINLNKLTDEEIAERSRLQSERVKIIHSSRDIETKKAIAEKISNTLRRDPIPLEHIETGKIIALGYVQWKKQHNVNVSVLKNGIQKKTHGWKLPTHASS